MKGKDSEKATGIIQDHWDKSRIYALLESKPLNPRKTNEFFVAKPHYKPEKVLLILFIHF